MKLYIWKSFELQRTVKVNCDVGFCEYDDAHENPLALRGAVCHISLWG